MGVDFITDKKGDLEIKYTFNGKPHTYKIERKPFTGVYKDEIPELEDSDDYELLKGTYR